MSKHSKNKKQQSINTQDDKKEDEESSKSSEGKGKEEEKLYKKAQADPDFLEFLTIHSKSTAKWGNDTVLDTLEKLVKKKKKDKKVEEEDKPKDDNDDKPKGEKNKVKSSTPPEDTFFTVKIRNLPKKTKKKDIKAFFSPLQPKSIR